MFRSGRRSQGHRPPGASILIFASLLLLIGACGDGDGASTDTPEQDSAIRDPSGGDLSGENGNSTEGGSLALPENLTIALPDGGNVTASITDAGYAYAYVEYPIERFDEIFAFYEAWAASDSRDWSGGDTSFEVEGETIHAALWNSTSSRFGIKDCLASGSSGEADAVCVEITDEG